MISRNAKLRSLILVVALALLVCGCRAKQSTSNSNNTASGPSTNANVSTNVNKPSQTQSSEGKVNPKAASAEAPPKLAGTYQAREIHDKGITTIVSERKSLISFLPDGTYSRVAQRKDGTTDHSDSGKFRIDPPDKLILTIEVSNKKIQSPPIHRMHKFSLSEDGDELKLTNEKGAVAVYRRTTKPNS